MASGIGFIIPGNGPGATAERVPQPLHRSGVDGALHRYVVGSEGKAAQQSLTVLHDRIGTLDLNLSNAGGSGPRVEGEGINQAVFIGATAAGTFEAPLNINDSFTVAVLCQLRQTGVDAVIADGYRLQKGQTAGQFAFAAANDQGGTGFIALPGWADAYRLVFMTCAGAASVGAVDGGAAVGPGTIAAPHPNFDGRLAIFPATNANELQRVVELTVFPGALNAGQRAAHLAALQAAYTLF